MVDDQIHDQLNIPPVHFLQQSVEVLHRAEFGHDLPVVADVIAHIVVRRVVDRAEPYRTDAQPLQVIQPGDQTGDVPDAVAVGILKAAGINLIEHTFLPPWVFHGIVHSFTMRSSITGSAPRAAVKQGSDPPSSASQGRL